VKAELGADVLYSCVATVTAGTVATADLGVESVAPMTTATITSSKPDGANGWYRNAVMVTLSAADNCSGATLGLAGVSYVVVDEYGLPLGVPPRSLSGASVTWTERLEVEARRDGDDYDGRVYQVVATLTDVAGNTATAKAIIRVPHDQR
jgi:hypothetical protein